MLPAAASPRASSTPARFLRLAGGGALVTALPVTALLLSLWQADEAELDPGRQVTELRMRTLMAALDAYAAEHHGRLPSSHEGLRGVLPYLPASSVDPDAAWWAGLPKDGWGQYFLYFSPGVHVGRPYELLSLGADGQPGGSGVAGDIASWQLAAGGGSP